MEILTNMDMFLSLLALCFLEIVLGIDNLVVLSLASQYAPVGQERLARRLGLIFALGTRLLFLAGAHLLNQIREPLVVWGPFSPSWRDLVILAGGLFLIRQAYQEFTRIFRHVQIAAGTASAAPTRRSSLLKVVGYMLCMDMVFSMDSIFTAIGMTPHYWVMASAIFISMGVMIWAAEQVVDWITRYPTLKILAIHFLWLIGCILVADAFHHPIPKSYVYAVMVFALCHEITTICASARAPIARP